MRTASAPITLTPVALEARFSDLVELICDGAHAGHTTAFREAQYIVLKAWMHEHFPQVAAVFSEALCAEFECLFFPSSLTALLEQDDGSLMTRLLETQAAITAWKNSQVT